MPRDIKESLRDGLVHSGLFFLLLSSLLVPFIHLLAFWILPLPFLLLRVKQNRFAMAIPAILFGLLFSLFPHPVFAFFFLFAWVVGWAMGTVFGWRRSTGTDVVLAGFLAGTLSVLMFLAGQAWLGLFDSTAARLAKGLDEAAGALGGMGEGLSAETLVRILAPVVILAAALLVSLATFWAANKLMKNRGMAEKSLPPFHAWRCPKAFFHGFWLVLLIRFLLESSEIRDAALTLLAVFQLAFTVQGLSFIAFVLKEREMSRKWLIPAVLLVFTALADLLVILGMLDTATRIRERAWSRK